MTAIAIFVKTPGVSPLKTRLAEGTGCEQAIRLYRASAAAVAETASRAAVGPVYWATAEPAGQVQEHWPGLPTISQGDGGLGERMHRVLAELVGLHGSALLLGADAPQLDPDLIVQAARHLDRNGAARVIGPARDGGFWTFGANHVPEQARWTRVSYSRPDTLMFFRNAIGADAEWMELPMLCDLDTEGDMARVAAELAQLPHPLPRQSELLDMLGERPTDDRNPRRSGSHPRRTTQKD